MVASRLQNDAMHTLVKVLSDSSIGGSFELFFCLRDRPLWEDLRHCEVPLLLVVGERDDKFRRIAKEMFHEVDCSARSIDDREESCGHAVHLENPLPLINAIRQLLKKSK
ncbi:hypothetical protein HYC85_021057 [Camellia sinensis]|uniref:AB hydrolase-1 domain-containing protein n=1 Tax=Camellia sinensis TaxID=4442 RepID=A0A7J7GGK5_CAMSI|nr:hypothetical protein HYC85_021057 [Camellia sinensis]